jgi:hypothetical protein
MNRLANRTIALMLAMSVFVPLRASADDTRDACFTAYEQAQRLRQSAKLRASREQLAACARQECPSFVRADCATWLDEVEKATPTIVVTARDARGAPCDRAEVFVDGERVAGRSDGQPIAVDPGPHTIRYELDGRVIEDHVDVPEGSKAVALAADFRPPAPPPKASHDPDPARQPTKLRFPTETYVLGGVAAVAAVSFTVFALAGKSHEACAPNCSDSQVSALRRDYAVADISLLVALAAGGGAIYFALTKPPPDASPIQTAPKSGWWLGVQPQLGGASLAAGARF